MLTHQSAPNELWEPYLSYLLYPLRPLVLFGRDAALSPSCPKEEAVYYGWKDMVAKNIVLPLLAKSACVR